MGSSGIKLRVKSWENQIIFRCRNQFTSYGQVRIQDSYRAKVASISLGVRMHNAPLQLFSLVSFSLTNLELKRSSFLDKLTNLESYNFLKTSRAPIHSSIKSSLPNTNKILRSILRKRSFEKTLNMFRFETQTIKRISLHVFKNTRHHVWDKRDCTKRFASLFSEASDCFQITFHHVRGVGFFRPLHQKYGHVRLSCQHRINSFTLTEG